MAAVVHGVVVDVVLAAAKAVNQLTGLGAAEWLILWESDVEVHIVTKSGGTADADGRPVPVASITGGYSIRIRDYGFVGLAGETAGTVRIEVR